jgi:hypothetical protein
MRRDKKNPVQNRIRARATLSYDPKIQRAFEDPYQEPVAEPGGARETWYAEEPSVLEWVLGV